MKILQLIKTSHGASWALRQVRDLVAMGHDVHVVLPDGGGLAPRYAAVGATLHHLSLDIGAARRPLHFLGQARALRRLVKALAPDIVHSHFVGTTLTMRLALRGLQTKRLFQVPGPLHLESWLTRKVERHSAGPADYWAAACRMTRRIYEREGVRPERVGLAYYGTDFAAAPPKAEAGPGGLRAELGVGPRTALVAMIAFAYPPKAWLGYRRGIKGHEDLIDALALLRTGGMDVEGVFVGGAWPGGEAYFETVKAHAATTLGDHAHFLGTRHDVAALYGQVDLAVHPSLTENLGGAAESLSLAVPTIATDVGGFPDIVQPGETGWLVPARDPARLAEAIADALADPAHSRRMALEGQKRVRALLDSMETSRQIAAVYDAMVAGKPLP